MRMIDADGILKDDRVTIHAVVNAEVLNKNAACQKHGGQSEREYDLS
jgi:hypothetical protein